MVDPASSSTPTPSIDTGLDGVLGLHPRWGLDGVGRGLLNTSIGPFFFTGLCAWFGRPVHVRIRSLRYCRVVLGRLSRPTFVSKNESLLRSQFRCLPNVIILKRQVEFPVLNLLADASGEGCHRNTRMLGDVELNRDQQGIRLCLLVGVLPASGPGKRQQEIGRAHV